MGKGIALVIVFGLLAALVSLLASAASWTQAGASIVTVAFFLLWILVLGVRRSRDPFPLRQAESAKKRIRHRAPMTLADYRSLVADLPLPTVAQQQDFARFVCEAHSWYKHLPLYRPGASFHFFIDPFAGCDRVVSWSGTYRFVPRAKRGFHYSEVPTEEYRERFGYLAYSCAERSIVTLVKLNEMRVPGDDVAAVADKNGRLRALPPEVIYAGSVRLTAVIHPLSAAYPWWEERAPRPPEQIDWPQESGGRKALEQIFARCRELGGSCKHYPTGMEEQIAGEFFPHFVDPVLHARLSPERERQQRVMVEVMKRMCGLVRGQATSSGLSTGTDDKKLDAILDA